MSTISLKAENGQWEILGRSRLNGIWAENLSMVANEHGADTVTFDIKRDPNVVYPDLRGRVRCRIENRGRLVWSGSIWETPTESGAGQKITVNGKGLQYHLDEDPKKYLGLQTDLGNFKDARSLLASNLAIFKSEPIVEISSAAISMGWGNGSVIVNGDACSAILDLGDDYYIDSLAFSLSGPPSGPASDISYIIRGYDSALASSTDSTYVETYYNAVINTLPAAPAKGNYIYENFYSADKPVRYIRVVMAYTGPGGTWGNDQRVALTRLVINAAPKYWVNRRMSGKASILRASDLVYDALDPVDDSSVVGAFTPSAPATTGGVSAIKVKEPNSPKYSDEILSSPEVWGAWAFDAASGSIPDYSNNGLTLTPAGSGTAIIYDVDGALDNTSGLEPNDKSLIIDNGVYLASPNFSVAKQQDIALECIFQPWNLPQFGHVMSYMDTSNNGVALTISQTASPGTSGSQLVPVLHNVTWLTALAFSLTPGEIYHVILTCTPGSNTWKLYLNGEPYATTTATMNAVSAANGGVTFGATRAGGSKLLDTSIHEASFHNNYISQDLGTLHYMAALEKRTDSKINRTLFNIDEYAPDNAVTKRERIEAANAFHSWIYEYDDQEDFVFKPKPSAPLLEVGEWSGATFTDASMNNVEECYNWVAISAALANWSTDARSPLSGLNPGDEITLNRHAVQLAGAGMDATEPTLIFTNPSFDTNTSGWSSDTGTTLTRDTSYFDTAPASLLCSQGGSKTAHVKTLIGYTGPEELARGKTRCLVARMSSADVDPSYLKITAQPIGSPHSSSAVTNHYVVLPPKGQWVTVYVPVTTENGCHSHRFHFQGITQDADFYIDSVSINKVTTTLLDRLNQVRRKELKVESMLTIATLNQLADTFLSNHKDPPLKGTITVTRDGGVRKLVGQEPIPVHHLLNMVNEKILISNQVDPITGAVGRVGTIVQVEVDDDENRAVLTLDNSRTSFEALLSRLAAVTSQFR